MTSTRTYNTHVVLLANSFEQLLQPLLVRPAHHRLHVIAIYPLLACLLIYYLLNHTKQHCPYLRSQKLKLRLG